MELKFVEKPSEIFDQFEGKFRELADEFRSYGGVAVVGLAMRDDMEQQESHRFLGAPRGVAGYGLAMLLANECFETMYEEEVPEDEG